MQPPPQSIKLTTGEQRLFCVVLATNDAASQRAALTPHGTAVLGAVALFAGFAFWPNPQDTVLAQQQAVQQAIAEQIEKIEQAIAAIENNDDLTDDQKEALTEPLEQAQQALQQPGLTEDQAQEALAGGDTAGALRRPSRPDGR